MGADTTIEWATHTYNPWIGCTRVSPACDHCYAEAISHRFHVEWGAGNPRRRTALATRHAPHLWNRRAAAAGRRDRVFCASLADIFDREVPPAWRDDVWALIASTPHLDWLLLTKRPQQIEKMLPGSSVEQLLERDLPPWPWPNVWLGTTVENQEEADRRIPHLLAVPAAKRFLSMEPLLGPVDLREIVLRRDGQPQTHLSARLGDWVAPLRGAFTNSPRIHWVIVGGESGREARAMHPDWARSLRDQCQAAGTAFFFKQWGEWAPADPKAPDLPFPNGWRALKGHPHVARAEELYPEAGAAFMAKFGKKAAGATLDGREWREVPRG